MMRLFRFSFHSEKSLSFTSHAFCDKNEIRVKISFRDDIRKFQCLSFSPKIISSACKSYSLNL